mmetsp:Transcript_3023/g.4650  ORF Transcript_3023/g.4650 Transcript_3023/m.4650 type:complete len:494 (-) Transcript_3023:277-1758(-)
MGICPSCQPGHASAFPKAALAKSNEKQQRNSEERRRSTERLRTFFFGSQEVDTKRKPNHSNWSTRKAYRSKFLRGVNFGKKQELSKYGGLKSKKIGQGTGFFTTAKTRNGHFLVDPEGYAFYSFGVCSVRRDADGREEAFKKVFEGGNDEWAAKSIDLLRSMGFNNIGPWSDDKILRKASNPLPYTKMLNIAQDFGKSIGFTKPGSGHVDFKHHCIPVFHPDFEEFAMKHVKKIVGKLSFDSYCLGFFSDNELPWRRDMLKCYLKLDAKDPNRLVALKWMESKGYIEDAREEKTAHLYETDKGVNMEFLQHVANRYFQVCAKAIKKVAPNHLYLGSRFHGQAKKHTELLKIAGKYVDVVSINWYDTWDPRTKPEWTDMWTTAARKPFLITEFYAKGMDTKLPNKSGAGWVVKTQKDRGIFYEHFVLGLMEHTGCVGFHWFKFMDDWPKNSEKAKMLSNKGILDSNFTPYVELARSQAELNKEGYSILEFLRRS